MREDRRRGGRSGARPRALAALAVLSAVLLWLAGCGGFTFYSVLEGESLAVLPAAVTLNTNSTLSFVATGGVDPYTYGLEDPAHGSIEAATGRYRAPAYSASDVLVLSDDFGNQVTASIFVTPYPVLVLDPSEATVTVGSTLHFRVYGGVQPFLFELALGGGTIDPGTGTYTAPASAGSAMVRVTDAEANVRSANLTIVASGPLVLLPAMLTIEQSSVFDFSASGGNPPYGYSAAAGNIDAAGRYTAPATPGTDTVEVRDSAAAAAQSAVAVSPRAPANLTADGKTGDAKSIMLSWIDAAAGEEGFAIERKQEGGAYALVATVGPNLDSYLDRDGGLMPNTLYIYRARSFSGAAYSPYSNEAFSLSNP